MQAAQLEGDLVINVVGPKLVLDESITRLREGDVSMHSFGWLHSWIKD